MHILYLKEYRVQKNMLFNSILIHIDTHNDNQYVTETEDTAAVAMDNGQ
jgi:hypothetical protein